MTGIRPLTVSPDRPLEPGRYRRDGFVPSLSFEVADGWYALQDVPGFFDVQRDPGSPDVIAVQFARPAGFQSVEAMVGILRARHDLVVGRPARVAIGGETGVAILVDDADPDIAAGVFVPAFSVPAGPISIAAGRRLEIRLLDRHDGPFAVLVGGSVRRWDAARSAAEPVVASIRFDRSVGTRGGA